MQLTCTFSEHSKWNRHCHVFSNFIFFLFSGFRKTVVFIVYFLGLLSFLLCSAPCIFGRVCHIEIFIQASPYRPFSFSRPIGCRCLMQCTTYLKFCRRQNYHSIKKSWYFATPLLSQTTRYCACQTLWQVFFSSLCDYHLSWRCIWPFALPFAVWPWPPAEDVFHLLRCLLQCDLDLHGYPFPMWNNNSNNNRRDKASACGTLHSVII